MAHLIHDLAPTLGRQRVWHKPSSSLGSGPSLQPSLQHWCHQSTAWCKTRTVLHRSVNPFRQSFNSPEPGRSNKEGDAGGTDADAEQGRLGPAGYLTPERYQGVGDEMSPYAQERIADQDTTAVAEALMGEVLVLQEESQQWPHLSRDYTGQWHFKPGFLLRGLDLVPPEFLLAGPSQRALQLLVVAVYSAAAVMAAQYAFAANYNLGLALTITWMRDRLSLGRLLLICTLAWFQKLWIFWVFFVGARLDDVLKRIAPPIRRLLGIMLALWVVYLVVTPAWYHPTPWFIFANGNDPFFRGPISLMRQ